MRFAAFLSALVMLVACNDTYAPDASFDMSVVDAAAEAASDAAFDAAMTAYDAAPDAASTDAGRVKRYSFVTPPANNGWTVDVNGLLQAFVNNTHVAQLGAASSDYVAIGNNAPSGTGLLMGLPAILYGGAVVAPTISQGQLAGTGANAGQPLAFTAQQGQNQSGGAANNNGGDVNVSSGLAGTGGAGAAGLVGTVGMFAGSTRVADFTNRTIVNFDSGSPATVRYASRVYPLPISGVSETAGLYVRVDPSGADHAISGIYGEVSTAQLNTYGPAIKVIHAGGGDGIYVAQVSNARSGGAGIEVASFVDSSLGFISTNQTGAQPNKTLFNALWAQNVVPNFGMIYADGSPGNALTIHKWTSAVDGQTQIRLMENDNSTQRFGLYNNADMYQSSLAASAGTTLRDSPIHRFRGAYWNGAASVNRDAYFVHHLVDTTPTSDMRLYMGPTGSEQLTAIFKPNVTQGGILDLQVGSIINTQNVSGYTAPLTLGTNGATLASLGGVAGDFLQLGALTNGLATGQIRLSNGGTGIYFDGNAATRKIQAVSSDASDNLYFGDTTAGTGGTQNTYIQCGTTSVINIYPGATLAGRFSVTSAGLYGAGTEQLRAEASGVAIGGGAGTYGGGTGVMFLKNATVSTSACTGGACVMADTGALEAMSANGVSEQVAASGTGTANTERRKRIRIEGVVRTTNATPATLMTYSLPNASSALVECHTIGRVTTGNGSTISIGDTVADEDSVGAKNLAGTAAIVGTVTGVSLSADTGLSGAGAAATIVASGATVGDQVTGAASTTIDWDGWCDVYSNSIAGRHRKLGTTSAPVIAIGLLLVTLRKRRAQNDNAEKKEAA